MLKFGNRLISFIRYYSFEIGIERSAWLDNISIETIIKTKRVESRDPLKIFW